MKRLKFHLGQFVSSTFASTSTAKEFMPGVGKIVGFKSEKHKVVYVCEFNEKIYEFKEDEIYEYDPY